MMIRAPSVMRWLNVEVRRRLHLSRKASEAREQKRKNDDEGRAKKAPRMVARPPIMTQNNTEGAVETESRISRLDRAQIGEGPQHASDADDEGADGEGEQLGLQYRNADDLAAISLSRMAMKLRPVCDAPDAKGDGR